MAQRQPRFDAASPNPTGGSQLGLQVAGECKAIYQKFEAIDQKLEQNRRSNEIQDERFREEVVFIKTLLYRM
jgi:hypothetical protein